MSDQLCSQVEAAVESAIEKVVQEFQREPNRFGNERDIHWLLFHYLQVDKSWNVENPGRLIRAEYPTRKIYQEKHRGRGHYDLVVLDSESYLTQTHQYSEASAPWQIKIQAAVEVKLWLARCNPRDMAERINWDINKLINSENEVQYAYFVNLVQLPHEKHYLKFYRDLREYLGKIQHDNLRILCAPGDMRFNNI
jgi:hypothetical protein